MDRDPANLPQPQRSPLLRILAPLALVLSAVVLIAVVSSSLGDGDGERERRGGGARTEQGQGGGGGGGGGERRRPPRRYEVEEGDSLSSIAERFGIPVEELIELNPDIDPQALSTGEELRLR